MARPGNTMTTHDQHQHSDPRETTHRGTSRLHDAVHDSRGAVMLEYSILVGTVALSCAVGLLVVGMAVLNSFGFVRELLLSAIP